MKKTLLLILAFVALMLGSFIWFVATWNPDDRPTISLNDTYVNRGTA